MVVVSNNLIKKTNPNMKRILLLLVFSASLFTAYCQNLKELETIQKGWSKKVITGVRDGNGCGTGCMRADYVVLKDSSPLYRFADQQEWDYTAEEMVSTYFKDGVKLSEAEGERIMECFNNPVDIEPDKREMTP
jgi:hypothetical protein